MLTIDFDRLGVRAGARLLDLGSGPGRHAFEALRRGADVVCADLDAPDLCRALATLTAMREAGEAPIGVRFAAVRADALALPFPDRSFDHVIAAEVLEHIADDRAAMREIARVLRPGGTAAVSVPRWLPERVCWALSDPYHNRPGGHVRIYRGHELRRRLAEAGLRVEGVDHVHALHAPYWWLRCLVGPDDQRAWPVRQYHRLLVWDIVRRPAPLRLCERALDPLIGKSLVIYCAA
ncbi:MAG TPA: methyltransferase domain-containing protein [Candidatus Dormibacteraeota bacterium]|nr:methyltransferase domain-containing protein [Candidatus Dormibacteraeota bacterium]